MQDFSEEPASTTPSAGIYTTKDVAVCQRVRMYSKKPAKACLFPYIVMSDSPPKDIEEKSLLAYEMVHSRYALTERYGEDYIRLS